MITKKWLFGILELHLAQTKVIALDNVGKQIRELGKIAQGGAGGC